MRTSTLLPLLGAAVALGACRGPERRDESTGVGNPGDISMQAAAPAGLTLRSGALPVGALELRRCGGGAAEVFAGDAVDLVEGALAPLPGGLSGQALCGLTLTTAGPAALELEADGGRARLTLDLPPLQLRLGGAQGVTVDEEGLLELTLGERAWASAAMLGLGPGVELEVGPGDPLHDLLAQALIDGTAAAVDGASAAEAPAAGSALVGFGDGGARALSFDGGLSWAVEPGDGEPLFAAVAEGDAILVVGGAAEGQLWSTRDGRTWTADAPGTGPLRAALATAAGVLLADADGALWTRADSGAPWTELAAFPDHRWSCLTEAEGLLYVAGEAPDGRGALAWSTDGGRSFTQLDPWPVPLDHCAAWGDHLVAVGADGKLLFGWPDAWYVQDLPGEVPYDLRTTDEGYFKLLTSNGMRIWSSGDDWQLAPLPARLVAWAPVPAYGSGTAVDVDGDLWIPPPVDPWDTDAWRPLGPVPEGLDGFIWWERSTP